MQKLNDVFGKQIQIHKESQKNLVFDQAISNGILKVKLDVNLNLKVPD